MRSLSLALRACQAADVFDGSELIYEITLTEPGQIAVVEAGLPSGLSFFVADACNEGPCTGASGTPACGECLDAGTHYLVVDSEAGAEGPFDVDIVFNGHNHLYNHTPTTAGGITWVTTGGAGGMLDTDSALWKVADWPEIGTQIHEFHYLRVDVVNSEMTVNAIASDGSTMHSFTLTN